MRKILKPARMKADPQQCECRNCGCVFEYESNDLHPQGEPPRVSYWVECPECRAVIGGAKWVPAYKASDEG